MAKFTRSLLWRCQWGCGKVWDWEFSFVSGSCYTEASFRGCTRVLTFSKTKKKLTMLFDLSKPVSMSLEKFDEVRPFIDSVYTKLQQELLQNNECRLSKSRKSNTARDAARLLRGGIARF